MVEHHGLTPLYFNITKPDEVAAVLDEERPHVILHTAGISDPDYCEDIKNVNEVVNVNYKGAVNVFSAAAERGMIVVYLSSSQVFGGNTFLGLGHKCKENDVSYMKPINVYGLSKLTAEGARHAFGDRIKVVRTSHLFSYTRIMDKLKPITEAPTFIKRNYIYLPHFAEALSVYLVNVMMMPDVLHIAGSDTVSEYELLSRFTKTLGFRIYKIKRRRQEVHSKYLAPRPHFSGLDVSLSRKLGIPQYSYLDGIRAMNLEYVRG